MSAPAAEKSSTTHPVDEVLPAPRLLVLGLQHLFIMYAGAVAVPLIVGPAVGLKGPDIAILVSADLLISGIATIIQSVGIGKIFGVRLPVVAGATFTVVNPMIIIANQYGGGRNGLQYVYGAMLVSGVFGLIIAKPFSMVLRFFPPLVTGTVITIIGLSLIGADVSLIAGDTGTKDFGQPSHIGLAALVVLFIVLISRFFTGFIGQTSTLISIILGSLVAWPMGLLKFPDVASAKWFGIAEPFHFGPPKFAAAAIISMCIVIMVTYVESTADMLAVAEMTDRELSPSDLARGLSTDGLSALLAGFMNSFPDTAYAENVGLIGMTKVRSRWVVTVCGVALLLLGLVPKVGAVVSDLPGPVIGGAATVMFAMVTSIGIRTLHKVDFENNHNLLIVAISLSFGLIPTVAPTFYQQFPKDFQIIFGSAITSTVLVVFVLNILFNVVGSSKRPHSGVIGEAYEAGAVVGEPEPPKA
ncbi:nucleobase:cation symporter-2 family protein [Rudaeicoccus suwonensis]|uniref:NCS2 family nucleobase:cation symporter-2 n=1 Tax=Rudaeicoccus suwonensis TaxID=657409 RepID=A0A561E9C8_9MICO|nr:nucleobase:cation symporter-2 family protein [Rudaeicoccus suwonensis]TWE12225.1 NCS2 family nucleobase:cation symporter-2 [Rudaeicoccus suwonensis]